MPTVPFLLKFPRAFGSRCTAAATCAMATIILGCMSFTVQDHGLTFAHVTEEGILCHEGTVHVPAGACLTVYYPLAFPTKPNLEISDIFDRIEVAQQREDSFEVRNRSRFGATAEWRARGPKVTPPAPPVTAVIAPSSENDKPASNQLPAPVPELPPKPLPANP